MSLNSDSLKPGSARSGDELRALKPAAAHCERPPLDYTTLNVAAETEAVNDIPGIFTKIYAVHHRCQLAGAD